MAQNRSPEERARREHEDALKAFRAETEGVALRVARLRFGSRRTSRKGDPEDAVAEAYAYFVKKNYMDSAPPEKWRSILLKIVSGKALDMVKYDRPTVQLPDDHHDTVGRNDPGIDGPEGEDAAEARFAPARSVLDDLKPRQRDILDRLFLQQQSVVEIAADLGITERGVRDHRQKALERLKRKLDVQDDLPPKRKEDDNEKEGGN
jgi:RNA polymerase sigma factor (sigma-70 family)